MGLNRIDALISEIKTDMSKYDSAGLIDEDSLYRDIRLGLKKFGNDLPQYSQEKVIEVNGGYADLPDGFLSLELAVLCEPLHFKRNNVEFHALQTSNFYRERSESITNWDECSGTCCEEKTDKIIKESIYFKHGSVDFHYHHPKLLKLGKSFKKTLCGNECRNKWVADCPYEISLLDTETLQANFNKGSIYIKYKGLPLDEDGRVDMPDTDNGKLEQYLEYRLKRRLAEKLMGNNDAQGLSNLYQVYAQREERLDLETQSELRMDKITPQSMKKFKNLNRLETMTYELVGDWRNLY